MTILRQGGASHECVFDSSDRNHAKALKHRFGKRAALLVEEKAHHCAAQGDDEGYAVWRRVAAVAEKLP
jgi:hypothetical protein